MTAHNPEASRRQTGPWLIDVIVLHDEKTVIQVFSTELFSSSDIRRIQKLIGSHDLHPLETGQEVLVNRERYYRRKVLNVDRKCLRALEEAVKIA